MPLYSIAIPPLIVSLGVALAPLAVSFFAAVFQINDYLQSGTFLKSTRLQRSACCETFDFIVVGGGSAGAAVAARLSENPAIRVLLLEAGGDPNPLSYLPVATDFLLDHPSVDWMYRTEYQKESAFGHRNRKVVWPRGKSLGGSSNSNFMIYNRGNPNDFDRWAEHTGDLRWNYKNLSQYFQRIEDYFGAWDGNGLHGKGGPLRIEKLSYAPGLKYILEAATEQGYEIRDYNGNQSEGFSPIDFTQKRGLRFSTYRAYIVPSLGRKNLFIYRYTLATKIHFNNLMQAVGVSYLRHGLRGYAAASKEIVLCGGSINTPQLLMLSGIGPRRNLEEVGLRTLVDLPVGENLQDHVTTPIGPFLLNQSESLMFRDITVGATLDFMTRGVGPLTSSSGLTAVGYTSTSYGSQAWPDIMHTVLSLGISPGVASAIDAKFNLRNISESHYGQYTGSDAHLVSVTLGLPKSRGFVKLRDKNPQSKPIIDPRYYSDPGNQDISAMVQGVRQIVNLYENTTAFHRLDAHLPSEKMPGCEHFEYRSDEYFECQIRTVTFTLFHPTSTCSMGKDGDPNAVVDSQLRVFGVRNLRVADASIMPYVTNANTNAPSIVIGEMASDMIKSSWNLW